jgi:hypothetical protein
VLPEGTLAPLFASVTAGSPAADPAFSVPNPLSPTTQQKIDPKASAVREKRKYWAYFVVPLF